MLSGYTNLKEVYCINANTTVQGCFTDNNNNRPDKMVIPAGGGYCSPAAYRLFLQKILNNKLAIGNYLGVDPVCAQINAADCEFGVVSTPLPGNIFWHYSYAHWVEDDPTTGDGSFSSPGLLGFYPWINNDTTEYGIVARASAATAQDPNPYTDSVYCGSLIRKAYVEAKEQIQDCC